MAKEKVKGVLSLSPDAKVITVGIDPALKANYRYYVTIKGIKTLDGKPLDDISATFRMPYSPLYCSLNSLKMIVDAFKIPEENMLSYIREASKYADYIAQVQGVEVTDDDGKIKFSVEQFTRVKATMDCILKGYMERTYSGAGAKYTLDVATFQDSLNSGAFKNLLADLAKELLKWQDAIRGYFNEGRAKPKATRIGIKMSENSEVAQTTVDNILNDISRQVPMFS